MSSQLKPSSRNAPFLEPSSPIMPPFASVLGSHVSGAALSFTSACRVGCHRGLAVSLPLAARLRGPTLHLLSSFLTPSDPVNGDSEGEPHHPNSKETIMETNQKYTQSKLEQGIYVEPRIYLSRDGEYLIHALPGGRLVRRHVNFYKKVLGVEFTPKSAAVSKNTAA